MKLTELPTELLSCIGSWLDSKSVIRFHGCCRACKLDMIKQHAFVPKFEYCSTIMHSLQELEDAIVAAVVASRTDSFLSRTMYFKSLSAKRFLLKMHQFVLAGIPISRATIVNIHHNTSVSIDYLGDGCINVSERQGLVPSILLWIGIRCVARLNNITDYKVIGVWRDRQIHEWFFQLIESGYSGKAYKNIFHGFL